MKQQFEQQYRLWQEKIEDVLDRLSKQDVNEKLTVVDAMRYSLLGGGKRIRPILTLAFADALGRELDEAAYRMAAVLEMIHSYSLIHDDLPAMDNDDLRRGKATNHRVYGEGMAVLAGDALLNLSYEILLRLPQDQPGIREAGAMIAREAGVAGMIGGQCLDLAVPLFSGEAEALNYLKRLQQMKTGALIRAAVLSGYYLSVSAFTPDDMTRRKRVFALCERYADCLGLAFQIRDDLLDVSADDQLLGKTTGKDARDNKLTFVTLLGYSEAEKYERDLADQLEKILIQLEEEGVKPDFIQPFTRYLLVRQH